MPTQITLNQLLIVGAIVGIVFGLIPLILGFKRNNLKIGLAGFFLTAIAGTFFSMLGALPVCALFIWLVLRKPAEEVRSVEEDKSTEAEAVNENPTDVSIEDSENS